MLAISPTSVGPYTGTTITLSGTSFAPGNYFACLSVSSALTLSSCVTAPVGGYVVGSSGSYSESITVPPSTSSTGTVDDYVIVYLAGGTTPYISAPFTITSPPAPTFSASPTSVGPYIGTSVTLRGANFAPGNYFACLSVSNVLTLSSCVTSPVGGTVITSGSSYTGSYSESITVPPATTSGSYYAIVYTTGSSTPYMTAPFTVTSPPAPTLGIAPNSVAPYIGTTISVTGANFAPGTYFACLSVTNFITISSCVTAPVGGTVITNGASYTGAYSESIVVPPNTAPGSAYYLLVYTGTTVYVSAPFTIASPPLPPSLRRLPRSVHTAAPPSL